MVFVMSGLLTVAAPRFHHQCTLCVPACRLLSGELKLYHYSLEACVAAVLRRRVPATSQAVMAAWFDAGHAGE